MDHPKEIRTGSAKPFELKFETFMDQLIAQQQEKVLQIASQARPHLTPEDILNPQDFPELMSHPTFNYEEGLLTGLIAAQIGLRSFLFRCQEPNKIADKNGETQ